MNWGHYDYNYTTVYYSIYTGCCSLMTIDCFSLYKDIIYENSSIVVDFDAEKYLLKYSDFPTTTF